MYKVPSRRRKRANGERLNLIPILDSVFIFIFFLLMSSSFLHIFEINSNVPIVSDAEPPKDKKEPLSLTLTIENESILVAIGSPSVTVKKINSIGKDYNLEELHNALIQLKKKNLWDRTAILLPNIDLAYQELIKIMDAIRHMKNTDEALFKKDQNGLEIKVEDLFDDIIFGNIQS